MELFMKISNKKSGNRRVVQLSGSATVPNCGRFRDSMLKALKSPEKQIELVLDEVSDVDLAFIQVIASTMKTVGNLAKKSKRELIVKRPVPDAVANVTNLAGLANHGNCQDDKCVWCALGGSPGGE
jgi:anti-anti-sigma regulatory factor